MQHVHYCPGNKSAEYRLLVIRAAREPPDGKVNSDVVCARVCVWLLYFIVLCSCLGNRNVVKYGMACVAEKEEEKVLKKDGQKVVCAEERWQ